MTNLEKRIQDELTKRFDANGWSTIILNMKAGGTMTITPESDVRNIHSAKDIDLYNIGTTINGLDITVNDFAFSMEHLVSIVADFEENAEHTKKTIHDIKAYYETHIEGHTPEELEIGGKIFTELRRISKDINEALSDENKIRTAIRNTGIKIPEYGKRALELSIKWDNYKDWYESIYNCCPTF